MKRVLVLALTCFAVAAISDARDYTVSFPDGKEAVLLEQLAKAYPTKDTITLADNSVVTLTFGLTVCVPANAADHAAGVCTSRDTTTVERRMILRKVLKEFLRQHYVAKVANDAGEAARAAAIAAAANDVPAEQ